MLNKLDKFTKFFILFIVALFVSIMAGMAISYTHLHKCANACAPYEAIKCYNNKVICMTSYSEINLD